MAMMIATAVLLRLVEAVVLLVSHPATSRIADRPKQGQPQHPNPQQQGRVATTHT